MTNSRLAFAEGSLFITSKSFVKYLFTLAFILMAFLPQVNAAITVTSTPNTNNDFCGSGGPTLTLPVVATSGCGAGTITYKWYVGSVIPANQITSSGAPNYSGYTTSTLFVGTASALGSNTAFYAVLSESSGACSDIDTIGPFNFTKVSSTPTLSITSSPLDVCQNSTASYTVNVTAPSPAGTLTYNWYNAPSGGGFGFVQNSSSASTTSSYSYTARATDDQDRVYVDVSNACGTTRSDTVTLDVNPTPIVTVPGSMSTLTACEGDGFNVSYTIDTAEYQNRVGSVNWTLTASGDAALISLLTTAGNGNTAVNLVGIGGALTPGVYSATFTLATNTTESCSRSISTNTINVTIYPKPTITFEISPSDYCRETDTTSFKIRVSNASYNNGASTVNVNWSASITEQSVNVTGGCASGSAGLLGATLTGTGNGTFYYYPSTNLSPGTYTYKINSVTNTTNACVGSVTGTDSIGWTVFPRPSIAVAPTSNSVCEGNTTTFNINVTNAEYCSGGSVTDAGWKLTFSDATNSTIGDTLRGAGNGVNGPFTTSGSLTQGTYVFTPGTITDTTAGHANCSRTISGNTFTLTVNPTPQVTFSRDTIRLCQGAADTFTMTVSNAVLNAVGQNWSVNYTATGANALSGTSCATGSTAGIITGGQTGTGNTVKTFNVPASLSPGVYRYDLNSITNTSSGCVTTPASASAGPIDSIIIIIDPKPDLTMNPDIKEVCEDDPESFNLQVTNTKGCNGIGAAFAYNAEWTLTNVTDGVDSDLTGMAWYPDSTGNAVILVNVNISPSLSPDDHTLLASVYNSTSGSVCTTTDTTSDAFVLSVDPRPEVKINGSASPTISIDVCEGTAETFSFVVTNAEHNSSGVDWEITYSESSGNLGTSCLNITGANQDLPGASGAYTGNGNDSAIINIPSNLPVGRYTYTVSNIVNTDGPCTGYVNGVQLGSQTIIINVYPKPALTITPSDSFVCENSQLNNAFDINVTNARYCSAANTISNVGYNIYFTTDDVVSSITSPYAGSGNNSYPVNANVGAVLGAGSFNFITDSIVTTGLTTNCPNVQIDTFTLTVNPEPEATFTSSTIHLCEGESDSVYVAVTNAMLSSSPVNWQVDVSESSGNINSSCSNVPGANAGIVSTTITGSGNDTLGFNIPSTLPPGRYTYTITQVANTDPNPDCIGSIDTATIVINIYPRPEFTVTDSAQVCEDDVATGALDITVTNAVYCSAANVQSNVNYNIYYSTDDVVSTVGGTYAGSGNNTYNFDANNAAGLSQGYYKFITDSIVPTGLPTNCPNPNVDTFVLQVNPMVSAAFATSPINVCEGDTTGIFIAVTNAVLGSADVNWEISVTENSGNVDNNCTNGVASASGVVPSTITGSGNKTGAGMLHYNVPGTLAAGRYVYIITATQNTDGGCNDTLVPDTVIVNVLPRPLVTVNPTDSFVCENSSLANAFDITVTNARYCSAANTITDVNYNVAFVDNVASNIGISPYNQTGNGTWSFDANISTTLPANDHLFTISTVTTTGLSINCSHNQADTFTLTINPEPIATFQDATVSVCEGNSSSVAIGVTNALLNGSGVNWQMIVSEASGNIPTSCIQSVTADAGIVPDTITGSGNDTLTYTVPDTLAPGVYTYTIQSIENVDENCVGSVSPTATVTVFVYPKIVALVSPDSGQVCEGDQTTFDIDVTNAKYCSALNVASTNVGWDLYYSDATNSNIFPDTLHGSGNSNYTFIANNGGLLGAGYYDFVADSVVFTTPTACSVILLDSNTFTLQVNPEPEATWSASNINVCEGETETAFLYITNANLGSAGVDWMLTYEADLGLVTSSCVSSGALLDTITGNGNDTIPIVVPPTLPVGVWTFTLDSIINSTPPCIGIIGGIPTITVTVYPKPDVDVSIDTLVVCENTTATFDISVTNAEYCASIGGAVIPVGWELTHSDSVDSDMPASVWVGSGNMIDSTIVVNYSNSLVAPGPYTFNVDSIVNTTHGCINNDSFSGNEVVVLVNDLPVLTITNVTNDTCLNEPLRIDYTVTGVDVSDDWMFEFTANSILDTISGTGPVVAGTFYTTPYTIPGVQGIVYGAISNTTTGCVGNTHAASAGNVLALPDVTSFTHSTSNTICSGLTNDYDLSVINSAGKDWVVSYTIDGVAQNPWIGTGNGTFTRSILAQYHVDSTGASDTRNLVITSITWDTTTYPVCANYNVSDDAADVVVNPRPSIRLTAPTNVCVNYTADVDFKVNGVDAGENWEFDWYTTGPTNGPNNFTGTGVTDSFFTTQPLTPIGTSTVYVPTVTNNSTGCDSSNAGWVDSMIVDPPTVPGTLSPSYTICDGDVGPFTFTLTGYTGVVQRWDSSENGGYLWFDIGNDSNDTHTVVSPHLTTNYQVVVKSGACPADTSNDVVLFIHPQPQATLVSVTDSICSGSSIDVVFDVSGVPNTHNWTVDYTVQIGAGSPTASTWTGTGSSATFSRTLTNGGSGFSSGPVTVTITGITNNNTGCDTTISSSLTTLVKQAPNGSTVSSDQTLCQNSNGIVVWDGSASDGYVVGWQKKVGSGSWTNISGTANDTLEFVGLTTTTMYRAVVENYPCTGQAFSASATITIVATNPTAQFINLPSSNRHCASATSTTSLTYNVLGTNGNSWELTILEDDSLHTITGSGDDTLTFTTSAGMMQSTFNVTLVKLVITSGSTTCTKNLDNTAMATIRIIDLPTATINSVTTPVCDGDTVTMSFTVSNIKATENWSMNYSINGNSKTTTGSGPGTFSVVIPHTVSGGNATQTVSLTSITNTTTKNSAGSSCTNTLSGQSLTYNARSATSPGTIGTDATVCKGGSGSVSQTASSSNGSTITDWQSSTWNGSSWTGWTSTGNTATTQSFVNLQNTTRYRAIYSNSPCDTAGSNTVTITVKELPVATVSLTSGNDTICEGTTSTVTLTVSNVDNGQTFTVNYVEGSVTKSKSFTNNASNTHTFTTGTITSTTDITLTSISTTSGLSCSNSALNSTVTITVQEAPTGTIASYDNPLCHGETVDYTITIGNVGSTDSWTAQLTLDGNSESVSGTGVGTFSATTTNTVTSTSDNLILVSVTNNSTQDACASTINQTKTITVAAPTVAGTIGTDTEVCKGASGSVSQTTAGTGSIDHWLTRSWNGSSWGAWTSIGNTGTTQTYTNLQNTAQYRAIYMNSPCDTAGSNTVTITVRELPVATVSLTAGNDTICEGTTSTVTLSVSNIDNGQTFTIYYVEGSVSKSQSFTNNASSTHTFATGTITSTTDITLTSISTTSGVTCSNSSLNSTVTITVQEAPTGTIASYDNPLCHGETVDYTITVGNVGSTDSWTAQLTLDGNSETVTGTGVGTFSATTTNTVTSTSDDLILVSVTNNSTQDACVTTVNQTKTITVAAPTVAGTIGTDITVCKGASGSISQLTSGTGSISYWLTRSWNGSSWGSWSVIGNTATTQTYTDIQNTAEYRAIYTNSPCDTAGSNTVTVTVRELPTATLSLSAGNDTICAGATSTVTVTVANIVSGQNFRIDFTEGSTTRFKTFTHTGSSTYTFSTNALTQSTVISLDVIQTTSGVTCSNASLNSSVTVTVQENPTATIASYDKVLCHGETVDYTVTVGNVGSTDNWTFNAELDGNAETGSGTGPGTFSFTTSNTVTSTSDVLELTLVTNTSTQDACKTTLTETKTIQVDATTIPGVVGTAAISTDTTICEGASAQIVEYTTGTGNIVKWQSRVSSSSTWVDVNATSSLLNVYGVNDTTFYRAVYQNGVCSSAASNSVAVNPKPLPLAIISDIVDDSICAGTTADFEVTVTNVSSGQNFTLYYKEGSVDKSASLTQNASGVHTLTTSTLTTSSQIQLTSINVTSGHPQCTDTLNSNGTVTVLSLPYATITSGPDTLCQQDKIVFTVNISNVTSTDNWKLVYELESDLDTITGTGPGSFTRVDTDSNTAESAKIQLIEILNLSNLGTCKSVNTDDWDIYIYKPTEPGEIGSNDTICKGGSTVIQEVVGTPKQGVTVSWEYRPASASNWTGLTNSNTTLNVINLQETTHYRAIYKSGVCDTAHSNVVTITVRELPVATISGSTSICAGDSTDMTITVTNVGSTQDWIIEYLIGTQLRTVTGTGSGNFTLRVGNFQTNTDVTLREISTTSGIPQCTNDNLTNKATATININPRPFASLNGTNSPVCQGDSSTFTVTVSNMKSSDTWTLTYDVDDAVFGATYSGTGPGTYTITTPNLTDDKTYVVGLVNIENTTTGCDSNLSATMGIQVDATTQAGSVASDTTVCKGSHVGTVAHTGGNGSIIRWETSLDNGTSWATITSTASTYTYSNLNQTSLFRVIKQNGACAEAATSPVTVTVNELPVASVSGSDTICAGTAGTLTVTATNTQGEDWMVSFLVGTRLDTITVSGPLTSGTINTGNLSTTTDVTLKKIWMTSGAPQCSNENLTNNATGTIEVNDLPAATLISLTDTVCTGNPAYGKATISNVRSFEKWKLYWTINGGPADSVSGTGAGSFNFTTANLTVNPSTIRLVSIVNESTGCDYLPTDEDSVIVSPITVGGTLSGVDTVCKGDNAGTLTLGSDARGDILRWEYSTNGGSTWTNINNTASTYTFNDITTTTMYRVLVQNGVCGAEYSSTVTIVVNELPVAAIASVGANNICEGSSTFVVLNLSNIAAGLNWELKYLQGSSVKTLTGTGPGVDTIFTGALSTTTDITLQTLKITSGSPRCENLNITNNYTTTINVIDNPTATITNYPTDICKGETPSVTVLVGNVLSGQSWTVVYKVNNGTNRTSTGVGAGQFTLNNMPAFNTEGLNGVRLVSITNTSTSPNCTGQLSDSITINVDSTSVGGTVSGPAKVCYNGGGTLSLASYRGGVTKWQYSTDGVNYYDIANTADSLNFSGLTTKTWYRAVVMNGVCSEATSSVKIVDVQSLPTVTINNATQNICSGSSTTLSLSIGNVTSTDTWTITYKENGTSGTYSSGTGTSETITFGPYTSTTTIEITGITLTSGLGCSDQISEKAVITVIPNPTATITAVPDSLCEDDVLTFTVTVSDVATGTPWDLDYEVDGIPGATKSGTGSGTFTVNTARKVSPNSVKLQLTGIELDNTLGCASSLNDSAVIKVSPTSVGGTLSPSASTICSGDNATLTLSGETGRISGWEYSTDGGNTWTVTANTGKTLNASNITTTTMYRVLVTSGTCSGAYSTTATVNVITTPMATVTANASVCPNSSATFTLHVTNVSAADGWSVVYKRNGTTVGTPVTGTGSGDFDFSVAGGSYTGNPTLITVELVSITNTSYACTNAALTSSASTRITPEPLADFTAISDCQDSMIVFNNLSSITEGTIATYKWYFGDGDSSVNASPTHAYKAAGTYSVRLVVWSDNGCRSEITKSVTVYPKPVANFSASNVCKNADFTATDLSTVSSGSIVAWMWEFGDGGTSAAQNPSHVYATSGNFDVTLTVTTDNGCTHTITKTITVYILPEANFVATPVCEGDAMNFVNASAIGYGTMTYEWDFGSTAKDPSHTFTGFGQFNVQLIAISNNGCRDTIVRAVTVHPAPTAAFTVNPVCIGETSSFVNASTVPSGNLIEYFWDFGDLEFSGLKDPTHTYDAPGTYNVSLRVKTDKGCEHTFTGTADVVALPDVELTANGPTEFCDGDSVILSASSSARDYAWTWTGGGSATTQSVTAKTTGWYKVRITAPPIGCANEDSIFVDVWPLPDAKAWPRDKVTQSIDTVSKGQSIDLHASGGVVYSWNPTTYLNSTSSPDVIAERVQDDVTYTVTVTDANGCVNTADVTVIVLDDFNLIVYNAVTPNGDGMNDTWIVENIWAYPDAEVIIFNRYGMEVYRGTNYQNDWDATYKGNDLPDGPYYYVITHPDFGNTVYKGVINVIREKQ